ncbi:hypothetical protein HU200_028020 [Digitaria exilis]|uniref:Uncharacterized protein n=1 Tax=Digitaria exilis TaxID=1010633 RepID=A0A835BWR9_9POAL|nr:hypothetical protein HU200_028020 [Digitaria exilis]
MPMLKYLEYKFYAFRSTTANPVGIKHLQSLQRVVFRDARGISAVIDQMRKEAKEHSNRITLCVNGEEEEEADEAEAVEEDEANKKASLDLGSANSMAKTQITESKVERSRSEQTFPLKKRRI